MQAGELHAGAQHHDYRNHKTDLGPGVNSHRQLKDPPPIIAELMVSARLSRVFDRQQRICKIRKHDFASNDALSGIKTSLRPPLQSNLARLLSLATELSTGTISFHQLFPLEGYPAHH